MNAISQGGISREMFVEQKHIADARKEELKFALAELEVQSLACDIEKKEYGDAFEIKKYLHLESFDKAVMASLISSATVIGEDCLDVKWKHQDIYEKFFADISL